MSNLTFLYHGNTVTFQKGNNVLINATEMSKPFGKRPSKWLELPSTKEFLSTLTAVRNLDSDQGLVYSQSGGNGGGGGTWMHEDVAVEFARWLSPEFAIWCNDRIRELVKHGATAMNPDDLLNPDFIINLATQLKNEREINQRLNTAIEIQEKVIADSAPKVRYHDQVLSSTSLINTTSIAKELGMSAIELNKLLSEHHIIFKNGDSWVLYAKYQGLEYTGTKTISFKSENDEQRTVIHTYWTEKGRLFIHRAVKMIMENKKIRQLS